MKIGSLITATISFVIGLVLTIITYNLNGGLPQNGAGAIALIALLPLEIIFYIVIGAVLVSGIVSSFLGLFSDIKTLRTIFLFLLIGNLILAGINIFFATKIFGV